MCTAMHHYVLKRGLVCSIARLYLMSVSCQCNVLVLSKRVTVNNYVKLYRNSRITFGN